MEHIISVSALEKSYKKHRVLKGISFQIQKGSIFALLGSNGAGKTTTVNILSTLGRPDGGRAAICGYDVVRQAEQVRKCISLTGQYAATDEILTGRENLQIIGKLRHLPNVNRRAEALLADFRLTEDGDRRVTTYSGGMRRRLDIAMSLMGDPAIIFLDEPTTGLDPQNRLAMWERIRAMADAGTTVFLTTQYLEEAEHLADHIAVLHEGVIVADGTADELKEKLPQGIIQLKFRNGPELKKAVALLDDYSMRSGACEYAIDIQTDGGTKQFADVLNRLNRGEVEILKFAPKQPTLEDAFLTLIGEKKEETGHGA